MLSSQPTSWITLQEGLPAGVRAVFTSREGGVSVAPFDTFNLGEHVGDDPVAVAGNRITLERHLNTRPVFLNQVHGTGVVHLQATTPDRLEADACVSDRPGLACTVMVADCLPVLFAHASGRVVAAAHAGWRGLAAGVLEACYARFVQAVVRREPSMSPQAVAAQTWVWLGPCIGPQAFEVGAEVREAFLQGDVLAERCFEARADQGGKYLASLSGLARLRLHAMGLHHPKGNDASAPWCTVTQSSQFFSHRRDAATLGSTGRMAAAIWIDG